ncbi:MAG: SanA/YdcF family protein [Candidatus Sumerlaeaceae bacterium]
MKRVRWKKVLLVTGIVVALILLLPVLTLIGIDQWMVARAGARMHRSIEDVPQRQVALVPGARIYPGGRLSAMLDDRVYRAVELYKAGKVNKLLMSGDNSERYYDEVSAMRKRALELGVPSNDVVRDFAGFRTYDSIYRAKEVWGLQDLVVVTQQFHLPRCLFLADKLGVKADGMIADKSKYSGVSVKRVRIREFYARAIAVLDVYVFNKQPHFLGRPETLSGDAQVREEQQQDAREKAKRAELRKKK